MEPTRRVMKNGTIIYSLDGEYHRSDGPAIICLDGHKEWYQHGVLHRENGPAVEYADGSKLWYFNGEYHNTNGPAVQWSDGSKRWYINGERLDDSQVGSHVWHNVRVPEPTEKSCINST